MIVGAAGYLMESAYLATTTVIKVDISDVNTYGSTHKAVVT